MLIESDNDAANAARVAPSAAAAQVDELLRGLGIGDTWMGGGYLHGTPRRCRRSRVAGREPAVVPLLQVHDRVRPGAPARRRPSRRRRARAADRRATGRPSRRRMRATCSTCSPTCPTAGKLGRFIGGGPYALLHKAGWISYARHDAGLVYWPGGVFVAAVMTYGSGVGVASDVLAGRIAQATLERSRTRLGTGLQPVPMSLPLPWPCVSAPARSGAARARGAPPKPAIVSKPIPFGAQRKAETAAYARRHYGMSTWRLVNPRVIVEHYTASNSFSSAYSTFAADAPDSELHELPGTCAHFVIDTDGTIYQLVSTDDHLPPHGRAQLHGDRHRARRHERRRDPRQTHGSCGASLRADRVADGPVRDPAPQRDRAQREPDEPVPPRAVSPPGAARRTGIGHTGI